MVHKIENDLYDEDSDYPCSNCFSFASSSNNTANKRQTFKSMFKKQQNYEKSQEKQQENEEQNEQQFTQHAANILSSKDLVGNNKEFRMESNKCNLRIIGNGNRIRILKNSGSLQIIGNNTRLKIGQNCGIIKYTGNEGRICLGSESTQQRVDYIGCDGLLKVIDSTELNKSPKFSENNQIGNNNNNNNKTSTSISDKVIVNKNKRKYFDGNDTTGTLPQHSSKSSSAEAAKSSSFKPCVKPDSFDELIDMKQQRWKNFTDLLQQDGWHHFEKVPLPDLKENINEPRVCGCKCKKVPNKKFTNTSNFNKKTNNNENRNKSSRVHLSENPKGINISNHSNVVNHFGNIIIKNSVNISIT